MQSINIAWSSHFTEKHDEAQSRLGQSHKAHILELHSQVLGQSSNYSTVLLHKAECLNVQLIIKAVEQCFSNSNGHVNHLGSLVQ